MFAANAHKGRPRAPVPRGRKGLWVLALAAIVLVALMGLMMASADQTPYGATQVWSAEPTGAVNTETSSMSVSHLIGGHPYGQDAGSLPAATLIHVGAQ